MKFCHKCQCDTFSLSVTTIDNALSVALYSKTIDQSSIES